MTATATGTGSGIPIAGASDPVTLILKLVGDVCNINCYYCFEKRKGGEADDFERMTLEDVRAALDLMEGRPVAVHLHGGEPLLYGRENTRALLAELSERKTVTTIQIQTNGVLLDDEWLDILESSTPAVEIGLSLDGDEQHNSYRVNFADRQTTGQVMESIELLGRRSIPFGAISVIHDRNVGDPDALFDLVERIPSLVSLNVVPCYDQGTTPRTVPIGNKGLIELIDSTNGSVGDSWAVDPDAYLAFLQRFTERWISEGAYRRFNVEPIMSAVRRRRGMAPRMCHYSESKCGHIYTLYPGGRFGSCDELPAADSLLAHDVKKASATTLAGAWGTPLGRKQLRIISAPLEDCSTCSAQPLCGGGCMATRLRLRAVDRAEDYCGYRRAFVFWLDGIMQKLEEQDA
ncbi:MULTISPECIES: radical SAM/SPASM domain-containing protein [Streptomyces]|uniref:radical SAM/SPASM domain-containing protein n=1 Tax=Streptomyces TaxID=1883 RepID=UPI000CD4EBFF|nr:MULTISPECIES: radical SAM protein [Streptomyces]MCX4713031.1 radical SAM protein [Streptomyces griseus]QXR00655.1 radical SAM protein [Streptomyces sp. WY228]